MYSNSGYLHHSQEDFSDDKSPLVISSCGNYRVLSLPVFTTYRPNGRTDYQLLYIASGKAHFYFEENTEEIISAGHMILYRPNDFQKYDYYAEDQTEVFWVHFTGRDVEAMLSNYLPSIKERVIYSGSSHEYNTLFQKMIRELQLCKEGYQTYLSLLLEQLFLLLNRSSKTDLEGASTYSEVETAIHYFNEHYHQPISIDDYASSLGMSTCWFIRIFKQYTGITPLNYILRIRLTHAKSLLESSPYNVAEIASIIGYDNPLYFSRLFKKHIGFSPMEYRKLKK